ncbi:cache domain-containing sensor histidine kinase [Paenibacillus thalictri]|uniref:histidine kinase n=1 Tax=Paenibacillus thalictri TaxID=2527873 RepID=A0A4Q9DXC8_9BACL|nr:sensor histidine kinase [Paenibacillus thalictri]TBL80427.1 sensor histidine kinase [Paenibacillus thalictri]
MRRWNDRMLKTKMFISFSIVSLFIVGVTCLIFYFTNTSDIKNQTFSLSKIIAKQFSEMIDLYMQNVEELSLAISIDPAIQSNLFDFSKATSSIEKETIGYKLNPVLFNFSYPKSYVTSISIYTSDGQGFHYTKPANTNPDASFTAKEVHSFAGMLGSKSFILIPAKEKQTLAGQPGKTVSFIRRINKIPTQNIIGFVNINVNVNAFKMVLTNTKANEIENKMYVLIVNDEGRVVFENGAGSIGNSSSGFDTSVLKGNVQEGELMWNAAPHLYTYEKSEYTGWSTVILIPKDVVLAKQKRIQNIVVIVGFITMMLVAAVSYILSHQITLPLNKLMRKMSLVEQGDFNQRMEYAGRNEIGRLSRMYNHMLDSITRLIREAYESKLAEKNAQLSALHAQINPHFLYNTLNIMKSISRLRGVEEVAEISESLAGLFQYSMKNLHQPVALGEEIAHINNYFNIQQHRFGNRLELSYDIPDDLLHASLLKLTIQPLIENAVNHGLRRKRAGGKVKVHVSHENGILCVRVTDNGEGIAPSKLDKLYRALEATGLQHSQDIAGVGLLNIHQRIQMFYGKPYGLELRSKQGEGTEVALTIPYHIVQPVKEERAL